MATSGNAQPIDETKQQAIEENKKAQITKLINDINAGVTPTIKNQEIQALLRGREDEITNKEYYNKLISSKSSENGNTSDAQDSQQASTSKQETTTNNSTEGKNNPPPKGELFSLPNFVKIITLIEVEKDLLSGIDNPGLRTFWGYMSEFAQKYFYDMFVIPTAPNGKSIIVKPELFFGPVPYCNIIIPCSKDNITYSRNYKNEPTRVFLKTEPFGCINNGSGAQLNGNITLQNVAAVGGEYGTKVEGLKTYTSSDGVDHTALFQITEFEDKYGVRVGSTTLDKRLFAYICAAIDSDKSSNVTKVPINSLPDINKVLNDLAGYFLYRTRFGQRAGSAQLVFNPYIMPGYPFVSVEDTTNESLLYGYITDVTHTISDRGWYTTVQFNCAHTSRDPVPQAFPIVETGYTYSNKEELDKTYTTTLGIKSGEYLEQGLATLPEKLSNLSKDDATLVDYFNTVRHKVFMLSEYLASFAKGAKVTFQNGYMKLVGGDLFKADTQAIIEEYTQRIMQEHKAFSRAEVR